MSIPFLLLYPISFLTYSLLRFIFPFFKTFRAREEQPWVIGGHRGRIYEDNSAALHSYIVARRDQPIIWISSSRPLIRMLREKGHRVVRKNSIAARLVIFRAPVLIYSHGEDDLDQFFRYSRRESGFRVYLGHSHHLIKGGGLASPLAANWSSRQKKQHLRSLVDFDLLLTGSPLEKSFFHITHPHQQKKILPYGGAPHIDMLLRVKEKKIEREIVWFPTWRESDSSVVALDQTIESVLNDQRLLEYLERSDFRLVLISHINSGARKIDLRSDRITVAPPTGLINSLSRAALFISDYSSVTIDWLLFERPTIHFVFDIEQYESLRGFFLSPEKLQFGSVAKNVEELIDLLVTEGWREMEQYRESREQWTREIYPDLRPGFAERCYGEIRKHSALFWQSGGRRRE